MAKEAGNNGEVATGVRLILTDNRGNRKAGQAMATISLVAGVNAKELDKAIAAGVVRVNLPGNIK